MAKELYWLSEICMYELKFVWPLSTLFFSVTDSTQSSAASIQKLPDSVVQSAELAIDGRCIWQIDQVIDYFYM